MPEIRFQRWSDIKKNIDFPNQLIEESVRKLTACDRHVWRVDHAWEVAYTALAPDKVLGDYMVAFASALLWLEAKGLYGGGDKNPGAGTKRLRFFRSLGSGRRNARDGSAWTRAIAVAAHRYGHCEWDEINGVVGIRFEPHEVTEYQKIVTVPLRDVLFFDGDHSTDAVDAWIGALKHAIASLAQPRSHDVDSRTLHILQTAVNEYDEAYRAFDKAWADEVEAEKKLRN